MPIPYQPNSDQPKNFTEIAMELHDKVFTVASSCPEPYLQAMQDLIDRLLHTGASIDEARTAMQQLNNE